MAKKFREKCSLMPDCVSTNCLNCDIFDAHMKELMHGLRVKAEKRFIDARLRLRYGVEVSK